jgi:hypothetical protein
MKAKLVLAALAVGLLPAQGWAAKNLWDESVEKEKREERSVAAFETFRTACFLNYKDANERQKFLQENYFPASEVRTNEKLAFVQANDGGTVWNSSRNENKNYTIVAEKNGNCHVLAEDVSAEKMHKQMKNLALDTKDSMTFSIVDYRGVVPDVPVQTARFDVKDPDGTVYFTVVIATNNNPKTDAAKGVISMLAPKKK